MKVRLISGSADCHIKFIDAESFKVVYNLKTPNELRAARISKDGSHLAMGLVDGQLTVKSKLLEEDKKELDGEAKMFILESGFVSKAKNYKYFFRG